jgi:hypothetical protein
MADEAKVEKQPEKTPVQRLQDFLEKEGLVIIASPSFIPSGHGTFEIGITINVQIKSLN